MNYLPLFVEYKASSLYKVSLLKTSCVQIFQLFPEAYNSCLVSQFPENSISKTQDQGVVSFV